MSISVQKRPFLQHLKDSTAYLHHKLESLPISASILRDDISVKDYLTYLELMHDVILEVEENVFPILAMEIPDIDKRRKLHHFEKDFGILNHSKKNAAIVFSDFEQDCSIGFALGMMYVIEGSSLGGRVIFKHIQQNLHFQIDSGAAYFAGYGENTGAFWKEFITLLALHEEKNSNKKDIIAGANYAFEGMIEYFQKIH